eukprot:3341349-Rhodomonas_salina.2
MPSSRQGAVVLAVTVTRDVESDIKYSHRARNVFALYLISWCTPPCSMLRKATALFLSLIHISEPTRPRLI